MPCVESMFLNIKLELLRNITVQCESISLQKEHSVNNHATIPVTSKITQNATILPVKWH